LPKVLADQAVCEAAGKLWKTLKIVEIMLMFMLNRIQLLLTDD